MAEQMTQLEIACEYAKRGIKIFPCGKNKQPLVKGGSGFKEATSDLRTIKKWWRKNPESLIGSPNSNFTVIDIDDYDLCATGSMVTGNAVQRLKDEGIYKPDTFIVRTKSGGTHLYYKKCPVSSRLIGCLPNIDLLADGGYSILPDQKTYTALQDAHPWETINQRVESFDFANFSYICDEFAEVTQVAKELKEIKKGKKSFETVAGSKVIKKNEKRRVIGDSDSSTMRTDYDGMLEATKFGSENNKMVGSINYDNDRIDFAEQPENVIYQRTEADFERVDPTMSFVKEEPLQIDQGKLNTKLVNELFHNQQSQVKMSDYLGLKRNAVGKTKLMHSILPKHRDENPSMGIRWSEEQTHILVRDFANFYGTQHAKCDYNLVRLYATTKYKANVQRLSQPEFVIWFTRLLYESGVITLDHVMPKYHKDINKLGDSEKAVAEAMLLLEACKRLYEGYDGTTTFSDKFSSAWCGVGVKNIGRIKKRLVSKGFLDYAGVYDCSGGKRTDGFFETPLYKIVTEAKKVRISDTLKDNDVTRMQERRKQQMNEATKSTEQKLSQNEEEVNDKYPNMATLYGMPISDASYEKVVNFCEDFGISTPVLKDNMFMPVFYSEEFIEDVIDIQNRTFYATDFELIVDDSMDGSRPLIAAGESESFNEMWKEINQKHRSEKSDGSDEPNPHFVLAFDVGDDDFSEEELDRLTLKFNEYVGELSFQGIRTRYLNVPELEALLDGKSEFEE